MAGERPCAHERRCVGCRKVADKEALLRFVRSRDGVVSFDGTARRPGRGAYVCSAACFERACGKGLLARALKCRLGDEDLARLGQELSSATEVLRRTEV